MDYKEEYERWRLFAKEDGMIQELESMSAEQIEDAFFQNLSFGTGGLRGIIGAGTNRMNIYTVRKASQGLANYLLKKYPNSPSVAISYDSRIKSELFSKVAAGVFAANGINVWRYESLMPTPCLSYAVRSLGCSAGIMITASHNPAKYNGYKVYGEDGCQITTKTAKEILNEIECIDIFNDIKFISVDSAFISGRLKSVPDSVYDDFIQEVKKQSVLFGDEIDRSVSIVYTPLNGTGLKPVTRALSELGFNNITLVEEQSEPDGNFPTCPYPNPEIHEAMECGLRCCKQTGADLLIATDPDADRCGIAVRNGLSGEYQLLSGNEVGLLMLEYICSQRIKHGKMPKNPVFIKTIVTTDLAERIAAHYDVSFKNVLTGFKFIGEQIGTLEHNGRLDDYILGFEESYGYLTGTYVRDKDAVNAAFLIAEMFAFYRTRGISLTDKLDDIYKQYGFCLNTLHSYDFPGSSGMRKMSEVMNHFHKGLPSLCGDGITKVEDYSKGLNGLPPSDVLKFFFEGNKESGSVVIRPSGTEPKLKVYISITANRSEMLSELEQRVSSEIKEIINIV